MSRSTTTAGTAPQTGKSTPTTPQASATQTSVPIEKVAKRAYEKWLQTGCTHGCDKQHWLEAEQEIRAEMMRTPKR